MEIQVKKAIIIKDGMHEGVIVNIRYRTKPYEYVDLEIQMKEDEEIVDLKVGFPMLLSKNSKLGALLIKFGVDLEVGTSIDPDKVLIGKKVKFKTITEGKFAKITSESVTPNEGVQVCL